MTKYLKEMIFMKKLVYVGEYSTPTKWKDKTNIYYIFALQQGNKGKIITIPNKNNIKNERRNK